MDVASIPVKDEANELIPPIPDAVDVPAPDTDDIEMNETPEEKEDAAARLPQQQAHQSQQQEAQPQEEVPKGGEAQEEEAPPNEARAPVAPSMPHPPGEEEQLRHALTHLPYAPWCCVCVGARAPDELHLRQEKESQLFNWISPS